MSSNSAPMPPPETFTRAHAVDDEQPHLPESVPYLETAEYKDWLRNRNDAGAAARERETVAALDAAGVPALVPVGPGIRSSFPADRVRWLAAQRGQKSEG